MYEFDYQRPASVASSIEAATGEAKYLAGGQSLIQAMRLRLANAPLLIDLSGVPELRRITATRDAVTIGAMARHAEVGRSAEVRQVIPALADLAADIADQMVRNMGTLGGSLANADPAACYPAATLGLGATIKTDRRTIAADDFFLGLYETALQPGELIVSVTFPRADRAGYVKFRHPASRFAIVGAFVSKSGSNVRVAVNGAKASVFRAVEIETALRRDFSAASAAAVQLDPTDMVSDMHAGAAYRAALVSVMASRAVDKALK